MSINPRPSYRLPDGSTTTDPHVYSGTWLSLVRQLEPILGASCTAFDPGLVFRRQDGSDYDLPIDVAHLILRLSGSKPAPTTAPALARRGRGRPRKDASPALAPPAPSEAS